MQNTSLTVFAIFNYFLILCDIDNMYVSSQCIEYDYGIKQSNHKSL